MITFIVGDYEYDTKNSTQDGLIVMVPRVESLTATDADVYLIAEVFNNTSSSYHPHDKKYSIPMASKRYGDGKLLADSMTWYGDIAKTILANIIPLLYTDI